jgi:glucose/arabinose dehydrogenase
MLRRLTLALLAAATASLLPASARALPSGFRDSLVVSGLTLPTAICFAPDGRMFVAEIGGTVRVVENGVLNPTPVITLAVENHEEQGVLGLALHPQFPDSSWLYVCFTPFTGSPTFIQNRVSRFLLTGSVADPATQKVLIGDIPTGLGYHVAGDIHFAPDGNLFVSTGENGLQSQEGLQNSSVRAKLLRMTPMGLPAPGNPFIGVPGAREVVYYLGFRNPFRFAVQPGTGQPFVCDVGSTSWEEIDTGPAGSSFGWPTYEGPRNPNPSGHTNPFYSYTNGGNAAIAGATFYTPGPFPAEYWGNLFFVDHARGHLGRLVLDGGNQLVSATFPWGTTAVSGWLFGPVSLVLGPDGALYYTTYDPGTVRRIDYPVNTGVEGRGAGRVAFAHVSPNPFRGDVGLAYTLGERARARVTVHDVAGRHVATLADGEHAAGGHVVRWDGRSMHGHAAPPGVYLARLESAGVSRTARLARIR